MRVILFFLTYFYVYFSYTGIKLLNYNIFFLMSLVGLMLFVCFILLKNKIPKNINYVGILFVLFLFSFFVFISRFANNTYTDEINPFSKYILTQLKLFFASYFLVFAFKAVYKELFFNKIIKFFIGAVVFDNILGLLRFASPFFYNLLLELTDKENLILDTIMQRRIRIVGLGAFFFEAGIINSIALLFVAYIIIDSKLNAIKKPIKIYYLFYIIILGIGIFSSRTTLVGFVFSILYYYKTKFADKFSLKIFFKLCFSLLLIMFVFYLAIVILKERIPELDKLYNTFLIESGKKSIAMLYEMWKLFPDNIGTYIIGDGKWMKENSNGLLYYKEIDAGYLRILWYTGISGLVTFLAYNLLILKELKKRFYSSNVLLKELSVFLFVLLLFLNIKGYVEIFAINYVLLLYGLIISKKRC